MALSATAALADYDYTLSGNGRVEYTTFTNRFSVWDYKDGDFLYVQYAFQAAASGSTGDAAAPANYTTHRLAGSYNGYSEGWTVTPTSTYVVFRLCNDDAPPDTCSKWKRANA